MVVRPREAGSRHKKTPLATNVARGVLCFWISEA